MSGQKRVYPLPDRVHTGRDKRHNRIYYTMSANSDKSAAHQHNIVVEKAKCKRANGLCWLCHRRIDCDLPREDKMSFTLDHVPAMVIKLKPGEVRRTKWAHRLCNSQRGDGTTKRTLFTSRRW